jgi:hypothetical protein
VRSRYPAGALAPLAAALGSAADISRATIDELVALAGRRRPWRLVHALDADAPGAQTTPSCACRGSIRQRRGPLLAGAAAITPTCGRRR